ncbi:MAG: TIR domain-containing protein [Acidobacteriota bacterium]|nr:TIR domain-containing protein [Acidobacteriota bacterium]
MPKVFISYSRANLNQVLELEQSLLASGVEVWRDQHSIRGGEQWPKAIGEALAACDAVLLAWSTNSANTAAVEFEWNTALALGKKIIPLMLDETPLPASLKTFNWVKEPDTASAVTRILQALPDAAPTDAAIKEQVITKLASIQAVEERDVLAQAKALFNQTGLNAGGHIIQSGGNVTIHESRAHVPLLIAAFAIIAVIVLAAFYFTSHVVQSPPPVAPSPTVEKMPHFIGQVDDNEGMGISGVTVTITEINGRKVEDGQIETITASAGGFDKENIPGHINDSIYVRFRKDGYEEHSQKYVLGDIPLHIKLRRKR